MPECSFNSWYFIFTLRCEALKREVMSITTRFSDLIRQMKKKGKKITE